MRMIAFHALQLVTAAEHAVEFVDEQRDRFVTFVGFDHGVHVGTLNHDVALGLETGGDGFFRVAFQFDAKPQDAFFVAKQTISFFPDERFERRCQLKMNAGDNDFTMVLAVHVSAYGLG